MSLVAWDRSHLQADETDVVAATPEAALREANARVGHPGGNTTNHHAFSMPSELALLANQGHLCHRTSRGD